MFAICSALLKSGGRFFVYGPFNYGGQYTSSSNRDFDGWLKQRDENSGIRDIAYVVDLAASQQHSLQLKEDIAMPANNRFLVFQKD